MGWLVSMGCRNHNCWGTNRRYQWDGSVIGLSWDAAPGAHYYKVYYDNSSDSGCRLDSRGEPTRCQLLSDNVSATSFVHNNPDPSNNYYWVVACNSAGCSDIDSTNPAESIQVIVELGENSFAPTHIAAFNLLMVGNRFHAETFYVDFVSNSRFVESDLYPGSYRYANTGPNTGTLTLDYDSQIYGGSCTVELTFNTASSGTWSYICESGIVGRGGWNVVQVGLAFVEFVEGETTHRSILENTPGGINVGRPVVASGTTKALTYSIGGPDADSFHVVAGTGQIRTKAGVSYDYESRNTYTITIMVSDQTGHSDSIEVTVWIEDLSPGCAALENLRTNRGDGRLTLRWDPSGEALSGFAGVLGYQMEMRRDRSEAWKDRRTVLGRSIGASVFTNLTNGTEYQVRVRSITAEGDCEWSGPIRSIPSSDQAPDDSQELNDRFGQQSVGTPDHNFLLTTPERCRHTAGGVTRDANCRYENTGPTNGRIFLDFDDPSLGSCEVTLAYSSLTAGSFIDECFDAGVNTNVPFDRSFMMPSGAAPTGGVTGPTQPSTEPQRAPRDQSEFVSLVYGRDDFIPGLSFGIVCRYCGSDGVDYGPDWAARTEYDTVSRTITESPGTYTYEGAGPTAGKLTFTENRGAIYVFDLEFEPSGNVAMTVTDPDGNVTNWPGMLHTTLELGAQPILLPIPPSWSAAIAIETDFAPTDYSAFDRVLHDLNPDHDRVHDPDIIWQTLFGEQLIDTVEEVAGYGNLTSYEKIGRNRARITIAFDDSFDTGGVYDERDWSSSEQLFVDSEWVFDLTFTADDTVMLTATRLKDGEPPITLGRGTLDLRGNSITLDDFPDETVLPGASPQASGADRSGVEVAAAIGARGIGVNDIQTFLINSSALQAAAFQPGDWLEPKDGSYQRMMIVGSAPVARASAIHGTNSNLLIPVATDSGVVSELPISWTIDRHNSSCIPTGFQATDNTITQLSVVCMQFDRGIPTRGARFFSHPKEAEGAVQLCQRNCVLNSVSNVQGCVWGCETGVAATGGTGATGTGVVPSSTISSPPHSQYVWNNGQVILNWVAVEGADYYRIYHDDFFESSCSLGQDGNAAFCGLLADNVTGTTYAHANPTFGEHYYWVVACDGNGCSAIDSLNPAEYVDTRPASPTNPRYERDGSVIRVSWGAAAGADYYRIYHSDFFDSNCRLIHDGSPAFCELLAGNISGASYTHTDPDPDKNYYWVVACNSGGCSDIDPRRPATG